MKTTFFISALLLLSACATRDFEEELVEDNVMTFNCKEVIVDYSLDDLCFPSKNYTRSLSEYEISEAWRCNQVGSNLTVDVFDAITCENEKWLAVLKDGDNPVTVIYQTNDGCNENGDQQFTIYNQIGEPLFSYAYNAGANNFYLNDIYPETPALVTRKLSAEGFFCNMSMWGIGAIYSACFTGGASLAVGGICAAAGYFVCDI